jgi:hypothetical protein
MSVSQQPPNTSVIATNAQRVQLIAQLAESLSKTFFNGRGVTAFTTVSLTMAAVEKFASSNNLSGAEKFRLVTDSIPAVVDQIVRLGYITPETAANLKDTISKLGILGEDFINTTAFLTNNPELIQGGATDNTKKSICGCF